ncbi:MAG TPA: hypothetical protein VKT72_11350 [Candidatus Baltobacteraceae bacterium]|nr:hypothetical protein [Candidatus Baltobacteraceae bacterium]
MHQPGDPALLRPLSLGEIFDRAVTLYVRNFAVVSLIALVVALPLAVVQFVAGLHQSATFLQILDQIQHPGKAPMPQSSGFETALFFAAIPLSIVLNSFMLVAIASAIGDLYRGERPEWTACYARAARRLGAIALALLGQFAVLLVLVFAGMFLMFTAFFIAFLFVRLSTALGIVAIVVAGIITLAWFLSMLLCYLAFGFAFNALGNEQTGGGGAILRGFGLVFNRSELLRALLVCLALMAIYIGLSAVAMGVAVLFEMVHMPLLYIAVNAVVSLITSAFVSVLLTVYYFDVRVRREGIDLQAQIHDLPQTAVSTP